MRRGVRSAHVAESVLVAVLLHAWLGAAVVSSQEVPKPALEDLSSGDAARVRALLEERYRAVVAHPRDAEAWGAYAMALEAHRQIATALQVYARAVEIAPEEFRWVYLRAALLDYSDARQAIALYARAVELRPDYAPAHVRYGEALEREGELDAAEREFERASTLDRDNPLGPFGLGRIALSRGEVGKAIEYLRAARKVDPGTQAIVATLAKALFRAGDEDQARRLVEEARGLPKMAHHADPVRAAVQEQAVDTETFLFRAQRFQDVGQFAAAHDELSTLLRLEPRNAQAHLAMAGLADRMGRSEEALEQVERALELDPALHGARQILASALFKLERFADAEREVGAVLTEEPRDFHMLLLGALLAARRNDVETHAALLDRAFEARTAETQLRSLLRQLLRDFAEALADAGQPALAARELERIETLLREDGAPQAEIEALQARRNALH